MIEGGKMKILSTTMTLMSMLIIVACAPALTPAPPAATSVAPTSAPAAAATATTGPKRGGKVVVALWQSPVTLNGLLGSQTVTGIVRNFFSEGMGQVLGDGTSIPVLAKELPTLPNGGVSPDLK